MSSQADLVGQVVIVTGASSGIGAQAARQLHRRGATVVAVGRSRQRTSTIAEEVGSPAYVCDFADLGQVRGLAGQLLECCPRIDVLINNAGLVAGARTLTVDNHELTFQVNHLAPFLLTMLLRERLSESRGRVIVTSSAAHNSRRAQVDLTDLDFERSYRALDAYATTKLENVLFVRELARRWSSYGVRSAAVHPGMVRSRFGRHSTLAVRAFWASPLRWTMRSPRRGADGLVWLAASPPEAGWTSGGYYSDRALGTTHPQADDVDLAHDLWERSASIVGAPA